MAAAWEVPCPINRYRVDAAGYRDVDQIEKKRCAATVIVIECKQSREDFLRDRQQLEQLLPLRAHLERMRESIEEYRIKVHEPQLQQVGSSLFPETDEWLFSHSRLPGYRRVLQRLARLDEQIYGETKFFLMARYRLADQLYIAAPRGMIRKAELPRGWGLLECPAEALERFEAGDLCDERPTLSVKLGSPFHNTIEKRRTRWLRNIAVTASKAAHPYPVQHPVQSGPTRT
jgi:hypothetical protein